MRNTFLALSILFCSLIVANPVDTGHAKASLITNLQTADQEFFYVGIRLQMQEEGMMPCNLFDGPAGVKNDNSYERANVALKLSQTVEYLQGENRAQDAAATMIWRRFVDG